MQPDRKSKENTQVNLQEDILIVRAKRTPIGSFLGELATLPATTLGAHAVKAVTSGIAAETVDEVIMGCVLSAGLSQAPARQVALGANLPYATGAQTINKVCGSGLKAVMTAYDTIKAGSAKCVVAGGMESMSQAPFLLPKGRTGQKLGHMAMLDHMLCDGLENAYDGKAMGVFAQQSADALKFSRTDMDAFALTSLNRAQTAQANDYFANEMTPIPVLVNGKEMLITADQNPKYAKPEKIPHLKPAFSSDGTITAANASSISDGAAAVLVMSEKAAAEHAVTALAKIVGHATYGLAPAEFTLAPIGAIEKLLQQLQWSVDDVDLWEINEAFAMVTMATQNALNIPSEKVNISGGACALGHPIGASGTRILVTLIHNLRRTKAQRGVASLCIGGGEAVALAVQII